MVSADFGTGKSIVVLAIVVGCFAILWPKIFYPMMQAAFQITSSSDGDEQPFRPRDRPPHLVPGMAEANTKRSLKEGVFIKDGKPFPHPSSRQPVKPQTKSGGAMSIVMPIYTIGIVVFFLYTVLKLVFKKPPEGEKKPLVKDFHMDPNYHKFVCQQPPKQNAKPMKKPDISNITEEDEEEEEEEDEVVEECGKNKSGQSQEQNTPNDEKDYEIYKLRRKLEETEIAMQRIMQHMGKVSDCLTNACVLKEAGINSGEIMSELQRKSTDYCMKSTKPTLRINRKKKKVNLARSEPIVLPPPPPPVYKEKIQETSAEKIVITETDTSENTEQKLKRDSSINSDNSSFELLSQGISCSSQAVDISDVESGADGKDADRFSDGADGKDADRSSDGADISFEAIDDKSGADDKCKSLDDNDDDDEFVESKSDSSGNKEN